MTATAPLLQVREISRRFGGITALNDVSFEVHDGEIVGLIGPNGAGKTTLFNLISGLLPPSGGEISLRGIPLSGLRPDQICALGAVRTFQSASLLSGMTVWDNVHVASLFREEERAGGESAADCTRRVLRLSGLEARRNAPAEALTVSETKRVEIARALATNPRLLMTDEILAGLNAIESEEILAILARLRGEGIGIIFVEHDVRAVMKLCDRVVVIAQGRKLTEGAPDTVARMPEVISVYLGGRYAQGL
ncbi:ABC transporter ATP-binding protein [Zavarzinia compransoris]|uniref:ABC transporter ATP-binding protein n=1 Tax=Zavarzinia compransoris TaxID=1264899 RepID=A0A317E4Y5_9PROT|nr:ABC transporter ATP-binding protein [Zavarzinia compransoris]PWR21632.1 ABC transporter ATP-binding protein [Zavarzinia compransoris]TDP45588.1 amino acid/amide ABC transporter ATP-binding protein 1 (HAAT family) [Zavarzinia compransoris]